MTRSKKTSSSNPLRAALQPTVAAASTNAASAGQGTNPSNILENIVKGVTMVTSIDSLQGVVSKQLSKPFETTVVNNKNTILLPKNISELVNTNYLIRLYIFCLNEKKYDAIISTTEEYVSKFKIDTKTEQFLMAFGIPLTTKSIPVLPKNHGLVYKGVSSALNIWLGAQPGIDRSLFKTSNAVHPGTQVFGDAWGSKYPEESKMLNLCVNVLRNIKITGDMSSLLLPNSTIVHDKGLDLSWSGDLITPIEDSLIKEIINIKSIDAKYSIDTTVAKTLNEIQELSENIRNRQKEIKEIKDIIRSATSNRITAIYSPYKGRSRDKARKKPIKELISDLERTEDYRVFNPTVFCKLIAVAPFAIVVPTGEAGWKAFDKSRNDYVEALINGGLKKSTAEQLSQRIEQVVIMSVPQA